MLLAVQELSFIHDTGEYFFKGSMSLASLSLSRLLYMTFRMYKK